MTDREHSWPDLPYADWAETCATLHMWTQIVGKIRLSTTPLVNHWWNTTLYVTASGLATGPMPYGRRAFEIAFDFCRHEVVVRTSDGRSEALAMRPQSVADFYAELRGALERFGIAVRIWPVPVEVVDPIPFTEDHLHASYDADAANRFWRLLVSTDRVMNAFRARFLGKSSPVHFFWGSFDLAVTRFSGRTAPRHPGGVPSLADWVVHEAYSHECSSAGFWPGNGGFGQAAFYSYVYPGPAGFADAPMHVDGAYFDTNLREFLLPLDAVRRAPDPDAALLRFFEDTYAAAADRAGWDRKALERALDAAE